MTDRKQNRVVRPCISTITDSFGTVVLACAVEFACWCYTWFNSILFFKHIFRVNPKVFRYFSVIVTVFYTQSVFRYSDRYLFRAYIDNIRISEV